MMKFSNIVAVQESTNSADVNRLLDRGWILIDTCQGCLTFRYILGYPKNESEDEDGKDF
jgi:hypothetical protein